MNGELMQRNRRWIALPAEWHLCSSCSLIVSWCMMCSAVGCYAFVEYLTLPRRDIDVLMFSLICYLHRILHKC